MSLDSGGCSGRGFGPDEDHGTRAPPTTNISSGLLAPLPHRATAAVVSLGGQPGTWSGLQRFADPKITDQGSAPWQVPVVMWCMYSPWGPSRTDQSVRRPCLVNVLDLTGRARSGGRHIGYVADMVMDTRKT